MAAAYDHEEHMYPLIDFFYVQEANENHYELDGDTKTSYCDHHTCKGSVTELQSIQRW